MNAITSLFDVIETRSFSNIWYWLMLALLRRLLTARILGVRDELIFAASKTALPGKHRKEEARAEDPQVSAALYQQIEDQCRDTVLRYVASNGPFGIVAVTVLTAALAALGVLGFSYKIEIAQAVFFIATLAAFVWGLSAYYAFRLYRMNPVGPVLIRELSNLTIILQTLSWVIFITAVVWGMNRVGSAQYFGL